jgi:hypothetical protein
MASIGMSSGSRAPALAGDGGAPGATLELCVGFRDARPAISDISFRIMAAMSGTRRTVSTFGNLRPRVDAAVKGHFLDYLSIQLECCNSDKTLALRPNVEKPTDNLQREAVFDREPG